MTGIADELRKRIEAEVGVRARYARTLLLDHSGQEEKIVVVVMERDVLPGDTQLRRRFGLTPREAQVARLVARRLSSPEIAERLGISVHTVRRHSEQVRRKVGVHSRHDVREALAGPGTRDGRRRDRDAA